MAIFNTVYGGEWKWEPGANTVLYLPLEGNTTDASSHSRTVNVSGTISYSTISSGLQVLSLTGSQYLYSSLDVGTDFTISFYLNLSGTGVQMFFSYGGDDNLGLYYASGRAETWTGGSVAISSYSTGDWKLITVTNSGTTRKTYVNGVLQATATLNIGTKTGSTFYVGSNGTRYKTNGLYSKFIVENKARTADEITKYYNSTKANYS